jgi:hypothetical protein
MVTSGAGNGEERGALGIELKVVDGAERRRLTRREVARRLLGYMAAGVALSSVPVFDAVGMTHIAWAEEALEPGVDYKPVFLTATQLAALDKLCEAIVPGSHRAQSAEFLDSLLSVAAQESQDKFKSSLAAMDVRAERAFQKKVSALKEEELRILLEKSSAEQSPDYPHFETLKHWAVAAYYSSEMGMRELGWTPDRVFASYPICTHDESHS